MVVTKRNRQSPTLISARLGAFSTHDVEIAVETVRLRLAGKHPKADADDLLSDAGYGVALALHESAGIPTTFLELCQTAYRRAIDAHRDQNPPVNRKRTNPNPSRRDTALAYLSVDPAETDELDTARPTPAPEPDLHDLLALVPVHARAKDPVDREVLRLRATGLSLKQIARDFDVSDTAIWKKERRAIARIRTALGIEG